MSSTPEVHTRAKEGFSSRKVFIFAAIGSAVGLGNIWRFPYVAYEGGGGAFIIPYLCALLLAGVPLLYLDYAIGHRYRGSAPLSLRRLSRGAEWLGWWMVLICMIIAVYYAAILAWASKYAVLSFTKGWGDDPEGYFFGDYLQAADTPGPTLDFVPGILVTMIIGLVPYGWFFLLQRAYYAYEDGRTPFLLQLLLTFVAVSVTLFGSTQPAEHVATWVGVGQSLSNVAAALLGFWLLRRRLGSLGLGRVLRQNVRLIVATGVATLAGWGALRLLSGIIDPGTWVGAVVICAVVGAIVLVITLAVAAKLRVREVTEVIEPLTRRLARS